MWNNPAIGIREVASPQFNHWKEDPILKTTMDQQEGLATNKPPLFTGENYAYLSVRMKFHLMSLGCKVWETNKHEYIIE